MSYPPTGGLEAAVTHYAYVVEDIESAAKQWSAAFGAGPFFLFEDVEFELLDAGDGEAVTFRHSTALGQWGPIAIELQEIDRVEPPSLRDLLVPESPGIVHAGYISADPEADGERFASLGFERFLAAKTGPFDLTFFSVPGSGHAVEIYRENDFVREFFPALAAAAAEWDGTEILRDDFPHKN